MQPHSGQRDGRAFIQPKERFLMQARTLSLTLLTSAALASTASAQLIRSGAGPGTADILGSLNAFRTDLGTLNANQPGSFGSGRREINWDGAPDASSSPNAFPPDFFNGPGGRARGVVFSTPGSRFEVSANAANPPIAFGNLDPSSSTNFAAFSPQRLFAPVGSNITDVAFFVPGSTTPALTRGFGAIFSDVDLQGTASIEFFDVTNQSLGVFVAPNVIGNQTFSFLGVSFADSIVSRVRITSGNVGLGAGVLDQPDLVEFATDVVAMDDFVYGEPIAVPTPGAAALLACGLLAARRRR
jgi:hypothetical protein